jgi:hypothetical protein
VQPELEPEPRPEPEFEPERPGIDVGAFRQGSPLSQWALARYLVGRAVAESLGTALWLLAGVLLVGAGLLWWRHWLGFAAVLIVVALCLLLMRAALLALLRRLTALPGAGPRVRVLVRQTRGDVLRELRRLGLPGRTWTLPLLAARLIAPRRRPETLRRLRGFDVDRAVPAARLDELHLLVRAPHA